MLIKAPGVGYVMCGCPGNLTLETWMPQLVLENRASGSPQQMLIDGHGPTGRQEQGRSGNNARGWGSQATVVSSFALQRFANLADALITTGTASLSGRISWATWLCSCMVVQMAQRSEEIRHLQTREVGQAVCQWHRHW